MTYTKIKKPLQFTIIKEPQWKTGIIQVFGLRCAKMQISAKHQKIIAVDQVKFKLDQLKRCNIALSQNVTHEQQLKFIHLKKKLLEQLEI